MSDPTRCPKCDNTTFEEAVETVGRNRWAVLRCAQCHTAIAARDESRERREFMREFESIKDWVNQHRRRAS